MKNTARILGVCVALLSVVLLSGCYVHHRGHGRPVRGPGGYGHGWHPDGGVHGKHHGIHYSPTHKKFNYSDGAGGSYGPGGGVPGGKFGPPPPPRR